MTARDDRLASAERTLAKLDFEDEVQQRTERAGALAVVGVIAILLAIPAVALWQVTGSTLGWLWVIIGVLGAPPLVSVLRRKKLARDLDRKPIPPPRPTTEMWTQADPTDPR